jgi:hypothetical protein
VEVVIQVAGAAGGVPSERIHDAVAALGLALEPIHPRSNDPTSASYFRVPVADRATGDRVVAAVTGLPSVAAAYFKPSAEPA